VGSKHLFVAKSRIKKVVEIPPGPLNWLGGCFSIARVVLVLVVW